MKKNSPLRFRALLSALLFAGTVSAWDPEIAQGAASSGDVTELVERALSADFRVRVQAALILGKTSDEAALATLVKLLDDASAAVRAASAAALSTYGDPAALAALRRHENDENAAVKRQVASTIAALSARRDAEGNERQKANVLVKLGGMKSRAQGGTAESLGVASQASREQLRKLPGVALLHPSEDPEAAAKKHGRPVLVVQGSIRSLEMKKEGGEFVVSANVEFLMQSMPEYAIVGKLSGRASASGDLESTKDARGRVQVQDAALGAAVESALARSREALIAAARNG